MATLIPTDNTAFTTSGEGRFYRFLRDAVKPDAECFAWYTPSLDDVEPDFILYTPETGLVVFEVKDWILPQIRKADTRFFTLAFEENREESRTNPLRQGRAYVFALLDRIKTSCKRLLSTEPRYQGKPRLPVQCGVVFSNISREEFGTADLGKILPVDKAVFADDLALADAEGNASSVSHWRGRLADMFPPPFPFHLAPEDVAALRELLWPQARIVLPKRAGANPEKGQASAIRLLDARQESLARRLDASQAIVEGPAGSGKSLILVHKAIHEHARLRRSGSDLPVLVVCFNLTLVHYLKRLLSGHNARIGRDNIQVTHFYDLCRSLLHEPLAYEKEDSAYYELVTRMALEAATQLAVPRYGAVFVDEGQDFSDDMLAVPQAILAEKGMFWIAMDTAQSLYAQKQTWLEDRKFRRFYLRHPYRATRALTQFCASLIAHAEAANAEQPEPFPVKTEQGESPRLRHVADAHEGAAYLVERIRSLRERGVPYAEMMILYASRKYGGLPEQDLPLFLLDRLEENGIMARWPARDAQSKAGWDITTDSVAVSTIHSMKGLDAEAVFVFGLDGLERKHPFSHARSLAYVACTRARNYLDILYIEQTPLIGAMRQAI